jgi:hypothetical protein
MTLADVSCVNLPPDCVVKAHAHMRAMGAQGYEGIALWAGRRNGSVFDVVETIVPKQSGFRSDAGLSVMIAGDELHRVNVHLFKNGLSLIAQIHSHPGRAYHSAVDDAYPIVAKIGGLSLVVPDFARAPFSLNTCATYRLSAAGAWEQLNGREVSTLIKLVQ